MIAFLRIVVIRQRSALPLAHRIMYSACRELLCRTVYFKKTERAYSAEKATKARSDSTIRQSTFPEVSYEV